MTQPNTTTDASTWVVGVDLGGTNVRLALYRDLAAERSRRAEAAGADPDPIEPVLMHRERVGDERAPDEVAPRLAEAIGRLLDEAGAAGAHVPVGIGIAAMLRGYDGDVANAPNLEWREVPFGRMLAAELGPRRPVGLYNDVNAITYGEFAFGAGIGATDLLGVFIGTGIGGGLVAARTLIEGASNCAGEIGHVKVAFGPHAPPCGCGGRGCIEAFAGGRNLQARLRAELAAGTESSILALAGSVDQVTPGHLDRAAAAGDVYAAAVYDQLIPLVAASLANAIFLLNPDRLVLGGGMLMRTPHLRERIIEAVPGFLTRAQLEALEIVETRLGEDAGLLGSALLAVERLGQGRPD